MKLYLITTFALTCFITVSHSLPVNEERAALFLLKYGYLDEITGRAGARLSSDALSNAIRDFQRFFGLKETGQLDRETLSMMNAPRCGVKDKIEHSKSARKKRYALEGSRWQSKRLTYRISKYSKKIKNRVTVDREIARAFKMWSDIAPLNFQEKRRGRLNIDIRFETGDHGDADPFDGPGGTVGHAFFPRDGGSIHFDDQEDWTVSGRMGTDFFLTAAHEIGHSLGLDHSDDKQSIMWPKHSNGTSLGLRKDDIDAIQSLYGSNYRLLPPEQDEPLGPPSDTRDAPDLCQDAKIDTITRTENGNSYAFKGNFYWKIISFGIANGYPRRISDDWRDLEGNLDASLTLSNGTTYFFKGRHYWRFTNKEKEDGPKLISRGFEGIPDNLDAAVLWSGNGKAYFFKGNEYWRYESNKDPPVTDNYPKPMSLWKGLPDNIDAAFQWQNHRTYFFKDDKYYRLNDTTVEVDSRNPPYPLSTSVWWLHCDSLARLF